LEKIVCTFGNIRIPDHYSVPYGASNSTFDNTFYHTYNKLTRLLAKTAPQATKFAVMAKFFAVLAKKFAVMAKKFAVMAKFFAALAKKFAVRLCDENVCGAPS
jgi:hypothetical protein